MLSQQRMLHIGMQTHTHAHITPIYTQGGEYYGVLSELHQGLLKATGLPTQFLG